MMKLHIIFTQNSVLLSRRAYPSWREIQGEYPSYKASLGPWTYEEVVEYLADEYTNLHPIAKEQVTAFLQGNEEICSITFLEDPLPS